MKWLAYRIKVWYWLKKLSGMTASKAWIYSEGFKELFLHDELSAKDCVQEELSYWE